MPVIDGYLRPVWPLTLAETAVDWAALDGHVVGRRVRVEAAVLPAARRAAASTVDHAGIVSAEVSADLERRLDQALRVTVRYGWRTVAVELGRLRSVAPVRGRLELPDAGQYGRAAIAGLDSVYDHVRRRARATAASVVEAARAAAYTAAANPDLDDTERLAAVIAATARSLHNHVLELVGEALNLGRAARVFEMREPPTFAMRSEQLDKRTCDGCTRLHGEIVEVGSPSFFTYMPPAGCYGGGRCRGVYVFADGPSQVRGPATRRGPQPALPPVPPVGFPERRAA